MNLADWEARLYLPREGYLPELISCFSFGGRQERGPGQRKSREVSHQGALASRLPTSPSSGPEAGPGKELPELFAQTGLLGGAVHKEQRGGSCLLGSRPVLPSLPLGSLICPLLERSANQVWQPPAQHSKEDMSDHRRTLVTDSPKTPPGCSGGPGAEVGTRG